MNPLLGFIYICLLVFGPAAVLTIAIFAWLGHRKRLALASPEPVDADQTDEHDPAYQPPPSPEANTAPATAPKTLRPSRSFVLLPSLLPSTTTDPVEPLTSSVRTPKPDADLSERMAAARGRTKAIRDGGVGFELITVK